MNTRKPRILLLEDDPGWTRKVSQYLRDKYEVISTPSLPRAKELLNMEDFQLAIVDLSLVPQDGNDTGGFQFISYIRSSNLWVDLPIIVLTAYDSRERMITAFEDFKVLRFRAKHEIEPETFQILVAQAIAAGPHGRDLGEPARALVVEDHPQWQSKIKRVLEEEGCQVDTASTYSEAIDKLTTRAYHLATVDIRLDELDSTNIRGLELVDVVRRLGQSVDIIFISAYGTREQIRKVAFAPGTRDFIDKGQFEPQELRRRVRKILYHLIYISVTVGTGIETQVVKPGETYPPTTLKLGETYPLTISVSRTRPQKGVSRSRSLARPQITGEFELEVVVHPFDVDVLPGSTQFLTVKDDDSAEPATFSIIPTLEGRIELVVDFLYSSNPLARMVVQEEVVK